ncbi:hypothetical protein HOLleu_00259 [Holothuria leucospilota]|uniref:Uncharacterized protein n=1 Tax=Holothuria leucospilota TaxID=206669 RepID=A0A9Q1HFQ6_HOLLE|nr:hypothetical protein HOLleu_00259 [Holothuria leucospilota]
MICRHCVICLLKLDRVKQSYLDLALKMVNASSLSMAAVSQTQTIFLIWKIVSSPVKGFTQILLLNPVGCTIPATDSHISLFPREDLDLGEALYGSLNSKKFK